MEQPIVKVIAFGTMKGGVGKTTVSFNLGCYLAKTGHRVLLIDADPQSNLTSNFDFDIYDEGAATLRTVFEARKPEDKPEPEDLVIRAPINELPDLDLIPSTMWSITLDEDIASKSYREQILLDYFNANEEFFTQYEYIIFDCNPGMGLVNQNVFTLTDHIVLVTDPDVNSARGSDLFIRIWGMKKSKSSPLKISGLIMNNIEYTNISGALKEYLYNHDMFKEITLKQTIPHTTAFKDATYNNVPIFMLKKSGRGIASAIYAIKQLAEEMKERGIL